MQSMQHALSWQREGGSKQEGQGRRGRERENWPRSRPGRASASTVEASYTSCVHALCRVHWRACNGASHSRAETFVEGIIESVGNGAHITDALEHAANIARDRVFHDRCVEQLARISKSSNAERDYHNWLGKYFGEQPLEPYTMKIPLLSRNENEPREHHVACIPPHEMVAFLWSQGPRTRETCLLGPAGKLEGFWEEALQSEPYKDMPCEAGRTLPLLCHYDGCEVFNMVEFGVWQFSSLLSPSGGNVLDTQFLSVLIESELIDGPLQESVHTEVAAMFAWSFRALSDGVWPSHGMYGEALEDTHRGRMAGRPLAQGMLGFCLGFQADMKARREVHQHVRWFRTTECCEHCLCCQPRFKKAIPELSFADFNEGATWTWTCLTDAEYLRMSKCVSPWVKLPGYKPLSFCLSDWMHSFSLGVARDLTACGIIEWLENGTLAQLAADRNWSYNDPASLLRCLHVDWRGWIRTNKFCVGQSENLFTLNRLHRPSRRQYPTMTTRAKAVAVDLLVRYLSELAPTMRGYARHDRRHCATCKILRRAADVQAVFLRGDVWLTDAQAAEAQVKGRSMLKIWGFLARESLRLKTKMWKLRPKLHDIDHIFRRLSGCKLNPRRLSCLAPESFLGKIKRLAKHTHRGNVSKRTCQRYFSLMQLRASQRERRE